MAARAQPSPSAPLPDELTPRQLADAWKKDGGFDRLRKQLLHDFLTSPEKDALLADLDSLLPTLLASTTSLARHPRQARLGETTALLDKRGKLSAPVVHLENRLRSGKGVGRSVERELRRVMCEKKGLPYEEDKDDEEEEKTPEVPLLRPEPVRPTQQSAASPAAEPEPPAKVDPAPSPAPAAPLAADPSPPPAAANPPLEAAASAAHESPPPTVSDVPAAPSAPSEAVQAAPAATTEGEDVEMAEAAAPSAPAAEAVEDAPPAV
ncbi:hypothetical protein JCM10450v2_003797 [Rhodotorula kratochvilovae]